MRKIVFLIWIFLIYLAYPAICQHVDRPILNTGGGSRVTAGGYFTASIGSDVYTLSFGSSAKTPVATSSVISLKVSVKIYPSPTEDKLNIKILNDESGHLNIRLLDLTGKLISTYKYAKTPSIEFNASLEIADLARGCYLVELYGDIRKIYNGKFLKQ